MDQIAEGLKNNGERDQAFLFSSDMGKNNEKQKASFLSCEEIQNGYVQGTLTESDHRVEKKSD